MDIQTFINNLQDQDVIYLHGDLGSGKTTFVQEVLKGLGYEDPVRSPTFTLVNRYPLKDRTVLHLDLYRIEDPSELQPLALEEEVGQPGTITFIEWPRDELKDLGITPTKQVRFWIENGEHHRE